jgi:hypothetical protein
MSVLAGADFFTVEVLTWRGLVTYYVLFFLHLESRRVTVAGITRHPHQEWMEQMARGATQETWGYLHRCRYVLHDRDTKFCASFRSVLAAVAPAHPDDAHRPLDKSHSLEASLSHVEIRQVRNDYTIPVNAELYQIERQAVVSGLRKANVRVEKRLDGSIAVRFGERYLPVSRCLAAAKTKTPPVKRAASSRHPAHKQRGSDWCKNFDLKKGPKTWQAA